MHQVLWVFVVAALTEAVVTPLAGCYDDLGDNVCSNWWGWQSNSSTTTTTTIGVNNTFTPGAADQGQPTSFAAGELKIKEFATNFSCDSSLLWSLDGQSTNTTGSAVCADVCTNNEFVDIKNAFGSRSDGLIVNFNQTSLTHFPKAITLDIPACVNISRLRFADCAVSCVVGEPACSTTGLTNPVRLNLMEDCFESGIDAAAVVLIDHGETGDVLGGSSSIVVRQADDCDTCSVTKSFDCGARRDVRRSVHERRAVCAACSPTASNFNVTVSAGFDDFTQFQGTIFCSQGDIPLAQFSPGFYGQSGFRFLLEGILTANMTITSSFIRFGASSVGNQSNTSTLVISLENATAAEDCTGEALDQRSYVPTTAVWNVPTFEDGKTYDTPDLSAVINDLLGILAEQAGPICPETFVFQLSFFENGTAEGERKVVAFESIFPGDATLFMVGECPVSTTGSTGSTGSATTGSTGSTTGTTGSTGSTTGEVVGRCCCVEPDAEQSECLAPVTNTTCNTCPFAFPASTPDFVPSGGVCGGSNVDCCFNNTDTVFSNEGCCEQLGGILGFCNATTTTGLATTGASVPAPPPPTPTPTPTPEPSIALALGLSLGGIALFVMMWVSCIAYFADDNEDAERRSNEEASARLIPMSSVVPMGHRRRRRYAKSPEKQQ